MKDITVTVLIRESILMSEEFIDILQKEFPDKSKSYVKVIKENLEVLEKVNFAWCNAHSQANVLLDLEELNIITQKFRNKELEFDLLDVYEKFKEWEIDVTLYQLPSNLLNSIPLWIMLRNPRDKKYKIDYEKIINKYR
jgi:hypothetical protein|nr:MAG TPA: hypothetical protein [Caudoviricetes sp.]